MNSACTCKHIEFMQWPPEANTSLDMHHPQYMSSSIFGFSAHLCNYGNTWESEQQQSVATEQKQNICPVMWLKSQSNKWDCILIDPVLINFLVSHPCRQVYTADKSMHHVAEKISDSEGSLSNSTTPYPADHNSSPDSGKQINTYKVYSGFCHHSAAYFNWLLFHHVISVIIYLGVNLIWISLIAAANYGMVPLWIILNIALFCFMYFIFLTLFLGSILIGMISPFEMQKKKKNPTHVASKV